MLVSLVCGLIVWGFATVLNRTAFKSQPASKGAKWGLAVLVFILVVVVLSAVKVKYQNIIGGALLYSWLLYFLLSSLNGKQKKPSEILSSATESPSAATIEETIEGREFLDPARVPIDSRIVRDEVGEQMESQRANHQTPDFFQIAWDELLSGIVQKGLWAKAFSETDGDGRRTKATYIKLRVSQLEKEYADTEARQKDEREHARNAERERLRREERDRLIKEEELARPENMAKNGLLVCSVDSECKALGICPGDVIVSYDGRDVRDGKSLFLQYAEESQSTTPSIIRLVRDKQFVSLTIRGGRLGLQVAELV